MRSRKTPTRERILDALRRSGPSTAGELARRFRLSPMAVRQQIARLSAEGFVRPEGEKPSRGRPARAFALTPAARCCFPDRSGPLALEVLLEVEAVAGREAVVGALERRGRRTAETYRARLGGKPPSERLRVLARLRDGEGYLCNAEEEGSGSLDLVERHCPVASVAERFPEVCRIEKEVLERALGVPVERSEHLLSGDRCCRYHLGAEV